jgi:osmotically-inducible protein OsmY
MEWWYQKNAAETAVQYLTGVKGVSNLITIKPKLKAVDIESSIRTAFERNGQLQLASSGS